MPNQQLATSKKMQNESTQGFLLIITAAVLWAIAAPIAKFLFNSGITPMDLVQARVTYTFLLLAFFFIGFKPIFLRISKRDIVYFLVLGIVGFAMVQYTYFYTISQIDVGVAIALQYTAPSIIVIYSAVFLGKRIDRLTILTILLALAGCYLVVGAYHVHWEDLNWKGILGGLSSAMVFAFYTLYGEKGLQKYPPWTVFFYAVATATLFWNIIHPPFNLAGKGLDRWVWSGVFAVAILGTLIPFALFFIALKKLDPIRLTVTSTLEPIFATILAFLVLGEALSIWQILGGGLIVLSVILMTVFGKEEKAQ